MEPIVACTTFGLKQSTLSCDAKIVPIPNQSASRMMVPRLPGSRRESRAIERGCEAIRAAICDFSGVAGLRTSARAGEGELSSVMRDIASSPISDILNTLRTSNPERSASSTDFSPSTTKIPTSSRYFLRLRERMSFISFLEIIFKGNN